MLFPVISNNFDPFTIEISILMVLILDKRQGCYSGDVSDIQMSTSVHSELK